MDLNFGSGKEPKTLIFTNDEDGKELFRVYLSESNIEYDKKFEEIINLNPQLKLDLENINELFLKQEIAHNEIPSVISKVVYKHIDFIKYTFYTKSEQSSSKKPIKKVKSSSIIKSPKIFFERLKSKKLLSTITKTEFESYIHPRELGPAYVESYKRKSNYYYYQLFNREPFIQHWFFAENKGELFFSFSLKKV